MKTRTWLAVALGLAAAAPAFAAKMILNNVDAPGVGFNDPTPATPVGGNTGVTVGEQRLVAYRRALELWGKSLKSNVTVVVQGSFAGLPCTATGGTLAQAGAIQIFSDFPGAPLPGHWYHVALANAIAGEDLTPGAPDPGPLAEPFADDILANFNGNVGTAGCIEGPGWYYGLDNNAPAGQIDFLDTFMHEVSHGLGFGNFISETSGLYAGADPATGDPGLPDVYAANTFDLTYREPWNTTVFGPDTSLFLRLSAINSGNVVWVGEHVTRNAKLVLGPFEGIRTTGTLASEPEFIGSAFGAAATAANFGGAVVLANDGVAAAGGGTASDGCEPITNDVAGKIALIDRGVCGFVVKVKNAQNAGAKGVILANTLGRGVFAAGGSDATITIPSIGISNADGDAIKARLPGVSVEFFTDPTRLAGTKEGFVRLYAPPTVEPGSSISHFDTKATPSLLMEPFITSELRSARNLDLTAALMQDIGWKIETLKIGFCETHVPSVLANGQMLHADVDACDASSRSRGRFVACMAKVANDARKAKLIQPRQEASIVVCSALSGGKSRRDDDKDDGKGGKRDD